MIGRLRLDRSGASAAEFALVLPLLLILIFGMIDAGRFLWETNRAEKATQVGARIAVVTEVIPGGLKAKSYLGDTSGGAPLTQGDLISRAALGEIKCMRASGALSCSCATAPCPTTLTPYVGTGYSLMLQRMRYMKPDITEQNVIVRYRGSGLGYAGDPNGMQIAPLVTVELTNETFTPITTLMFGAPSYSLPNFRTTLTAEDSVGTLSN